MSEETALATVGFSDDRLLSVAESAEKRLAAIQKIINVSLRITNHQDWVDLGGKPYLQSTGAEKIARMFGICWRVEEPSIEYHADGHFTYTYKGTFILGVSEIEVVGTRSSKDKFFSEAKGASIPPSEIDKADVKKSAFTNCIGNGVTRLLGLRNLTWDQVKGAGVDTSKSGKVDYKKGSEDPNAVPTLPKYGEFAEKPVNDPSVTVEWLKKYLAGAEKSIAEPKYANNKPKNERLRDAIKAELAHREHGASGVPTDADSSPAAGSDAPASGPQNFDEFAAVVEQTKTVSEADAAWKRLTPFIAGRLQPQEKAALQTLYDEHKKALTGGRLL